MRSTTLSFIPVREYVAMSHDANDRDTLDAWLEQAQAHPLLTRQEEVELFNIVVEAPRRLQGMLRYVG